MKAIKKWLMDKEGVFIVITWWAIFLVVFSIMLGTSINNVINNTKITTETSPTYIQEIIKSGDFTVPYNANVAETQARYDQENEDYYLAINKYNKYGIEEYSGNVSLSGDASATAKINLDLTLINVYSIQYNHSDKNVAISLESVKLEDFGTFDAKIKKTPSGELHIIWNDSDTGVSYSAKNVIEFSREDDLLVVNGTKTSVPFYDFEEGETVSYKELEFEKTSKTVDLDLIVSYEIGAKEFTVKNYSTEGLTDVEKEVFENSVDYFTELIEESIGIKKSAFPLLIVSAIVDVLLIGFGVAGVILLSKSKKK